MPRYCNKLFDVNLTFIICSLQIDRHKGFCSRDVLVLRNRITSIPTWDVSCSYVQIDRKNFSSQKRSTECDEQQSFVILGQWNSSPTDDTRLFRSRWYLQASTGMMNMILYVFRNWYHVHRSVRVIHTCIIFICSIFNKVLSKSYWKNIC